MWVRSQDKTRLIEVSQVERTGTWISCNKWTLGKYETLEQAMEVMNMIEHHINEGHQEVFLMAEDIDIKNDLSGVAIPSRSNNINQANCSTNEGIKQVHLFSSNQLMILISILNRNIESLENGFTDDAIISLKRLTKNLMKNLRGEEN